jgi:hypothetical protein
MPTTREKIRDIIINDAVPNYPDYTYKINQIMQIIEEEKTVTKKECAELIFKALDERKEL